MRLLDGSIFELYGSLFELRQRMLSYGSFVWVEALVGDGWWKQRLVNVALHLAVVVALYALFARLLSIALRQSQGVVVDLKPANGLGPSGLAALRVGVALFAVNPVAVYAVSYLVQRSVLMATLFSVLACLAFVLGLERGRGAWFVAAILFYAFALLSKGHAFMIAAMSVPLYVFVRGPNWRALAWILIGGGGVLVAAVAGLLHFYGDLVGKAFDPASRIYIAQIEALAPGVADSVWALSILNQTALFFAYGFLWFVPNVLWMSVDLRPEFPLSWLSFPELLAALVWLALLALCVHAVLRRRGLPALLGLCMLFPLLLFVTEFATVWIQDPFVLYRSYLWAIAMPGMIAVLLCSLRPGTLYVGGLVVALLFSGLALERSLSLASAYSAWNDAVEKVDLGADASAVGRWRPFLNRGSYFLEHSMYRQAANDFARAVQLGEGEGSASFNLGVALQQMQRDEEALAAFEAAREKGFDEAGLHFHRGESLYRLGQSGEAVKAYSAALKRPRQAPEVRDHTRMRRAEAAVAARDFSLAAKDFEALLVRDPGNVRVLTGLGMAYVGQQRGTDALRVFDALLERREAPTLRYGRAMARALAGDRAGAIIDIENALAVEPDNPAFRQLREQLGR
ncbi:tetratricopeptide repeat protein [Pseudazoarcus pumilus]|uniref:tetratricopeptide repeat protein n=1 Tax=Pseudazoarcus pumilus TaxID=2067960 RepID=UPI0018F877AA|nr:tetratricopeptide repeat protein [Pseudazoarcus pumilus]